MDRLGLRGLQDRQGPCMTWELARLSLKLGRCFMLGVEVEGEKWEGRTYPRPLSLGD